MNAAAANIIGKGELAALLGWSRTRLDRRLQSDATFPVLRRGGRSGGWEFDVDQVRQHVGTSQRDRGPARRKAKASLCARDGADAPRPTLGKKELCAQLGWSRMRLDRRLKEDPGFPIVRLGDQSGGWEFDCVNVQAYLAGTAALKVAPAGLDPAQLPDAVAARSPKSSIVEALARGRRSAHHAGETTARQRKDVAQAEMLELKLGIERGKYMPAEDVRRLSADFFAHLVAHLDRLPQSLVQAFDLPDTGLSLIRQFLDDARTEMVSDLEKLCDNAESNPAPEGGDNADTAQP